MAEPRAAFQDQDGEWIYGCESVHPVDDVRCMLLDGHDDAYHEWCWYDALGRQRDYVRWTGADMECEDG